jgi:hypothetical protein
MKESRIYLSELQDDDLITIQDGFYKTIKLKQTFESLSKLFLYCFGDFSNHYSSRARDLGLLIHNQNYGKHGSFCLNPQFVEDGFDYKFIKLGCPGWQTGKFKLSLQTYLSLNETEDDKKQLISYYDFSATNFNDEDVISFVEDKFCTWKILKDFFQESFENEKLYNDYSSVLAQNIPEMKDIKSFFKYGINSKFLKIATATWQPATLRISFILETQSNVDGVEQNTMEPSPLDEIRNLTI